MSVRRKHHEEEGHAEIDLAPMLDFIMNLLIFFIITTSFVKQTGVKVTQEEAYTAEYKENGNILIAIRPNGDVWMDRRRVTLPEVRATIERMHAERPEDTVIITADKAAENGVLVKVMDQVRAGGIESVSLATLPQGG
ncbi:MAG: biopolymer transporter ExbD [Pseudomonadota bacterium]